MDYENAAPRGKDLIISGIRHFDPEQTLDCGQCFRWKGSDDVPGSVFTGFAHGRRLELRVVDGCDLVLGDVSPNEFETIWKGYFDLDRDYGSLRKSFSREPHLSRAAEFSPGLRLLRQEPWETLITFILSQNSNIPRIKGMISRLCECFGTPLRGGGYAFPDARKLAGLSARDLDSVRCGYRAAYIIDAASMVSDGRMDLGELALLPSEQMVKSLMRIRGVGPKVADCTLLFGFGRVERVPLDVWMKRVMSRFYPEGLPGNLLPVAGIAQQFLFRYARANLR